MLFFKTVIITLLFILAIDVQAEDKKIFSNQFGDVEVPVNPQCVVSLHDFSLTIQLMELGVTPCGSVARKKLWKPAYFRGAQHRFNTDAIKYVGSHSSPDIEAIASLKPDLIIGLSYQKKWVEKLATIAPVVILPTRESHTTIWAEQLASLVNKSDKFKQQQKEYNWILAEFNRLLPNASEISITTLEVYEDNFQLIGRGGLDHVIEDMKLGRVEAYQKAKKGVNYSLERISDFNSDVIVDTYEPLLNSREDTQDFRNSLQWKNLFAIKNNQFLYFHRSRYGESMGGLIGSAYLLSSHLTERPLKSQP